MTIKECIDQVDNVKPNQYGIEEKVEWLSFLDGIIINDVIKTHEGYNNEYEDFDGYSADKLGKKLIVDKPYDKLYVAYLKMKIDEANGETARYNNSATMFNSYLLEFKKYYNKTHMPLSIHNRNNPKPTKQNGGTQISGTELENIKREILSQLQELITDSLSNDKIYDIVMQYVYNHTNELKGKDGLDGYTPQKGVDYFDGKDGKDGNVGKTGKSAYEYAKEGGYTGTEADFAKKMAQEMSAKIGEVTLYASKWYGEGNLFSQVVRIPEVTRNSQVDLTPSAEQLAVFYEKDLALVTENDEGVVTVYAIGQKPQNDYTIQVTITEVSYE